VLRTLLMFGVMGVLLPLTALNPFIGVILWDWISLMNPHKLITGAATDQPWALIIFVMTMLGCAIRPSHWKLPINRTTILFAVFLAGITLTTLTAMAPNAATKWSLVSKSILFLFVTAALLTDVRRIHALVWAIAIAIGFFGVKGGGFTLLTAGTQHVYGPPETMIQDNNHLAAALVVILPLLNYLRLHSRHRIVQIGLMITMGLTLCSIVGSYSRGAMVGLAIVIGVTFLTNLRRLGLGLVLVVAMAGGLSFMPAQWTQRMGTIQTYQQDDSATTRITMWQTAWKLAVAHPVVGSGFLGPYTRSVVDTVAPGMPARAVHSIWFELLGEQGFPLFFVWLALMVTGVLNCSQTIRVAGADPALRWAVDLAKALRISILGYAVTGTFLSLSYWDGYYTLLIITAAVRAQALQAAASRELPRAARSWRKAPQPWRPPAVIAAKLQPPTPGR
jgi:putative inorganic carbon (HCO3(-)) transporter